MYEAGMPETLKFYLKYATLPCKMRNTVKQNCI